MTLSECQSCFSLSYHQFIAQYNIEASQIVGNVAYEKLKQLSRIAFDNRYYFFNGSDLKLIYTSNGLLANELWIEFKAANNNNIVPSITLRSRAGKTARQEVYAGQGFTISITGDDIHFIEIYRSMSPDEYLDEIYRVVGPFIR